MLNPGIFREYDIRGIADTELTSPGVEDLGRAIGTFFRRKASLATPRCAVGRDARLSGPRLRDAVVAGLTSTGCDVTDLGLVPTPACYFAAHDRKLDGAVMITGSHNPAEYNGFKTVFGGGTIHGEDIQQLLGYIQAQDFEKGAGRVGAEDVIPDYVDAVACGFDFKRRIKVVFDAGNGAGGPAMKRILERLNVDAVEMFFEPDGRFPNHHPDPTVPENLHHLMERVKADKADLGIAFDGDADRIGACDENGNVIYGDVMMLIFAREILTRKPGATFIGDVKCSQIMYDELTRLGGKPIMYKTGHSLIKAKMKQERAELAGEMSGHMFFGDRYFGFDDALYAACRLMEIVSISGKPLSAQVDGLPRTVTTPELRADCADDHKFPLVARIVERFKKTHKVIDIDGARILFENGWGLLRASNTQPVLVMRFEAETPEQLKAYRATVEGALAEEKAAMGIA